MDVILLRRLKAERGRRGIGVCHVPCHSNPEYIFLDSEGYDIWIGIGPSVWSMCLLSLLVSPPGTCGSAADVHAGVRARRLLWSADGILARAERLVGDSID